MPRLCPCNAELSISPSSPCETLSLTSIKDLRHHYSKSIIGAELRLSFVFYLLLLVFYICFFNLFLFLFVCLFVFLFVFYLFFYLSFICLFTCFFLFFLFLLLSFLPFHFSTFSFYLISTSIFHTGKRVQSISLGRSRGTVKGSSKPSPPQDEGGGGDVRPGTSAGKAIYIL